MQEIGQHNIGCRWMMKAVFHHLALKIPAGPVQESSAVREEEPVVTPQPVYQQGLLITAESEQEGLVLLLPGPTQFLFMSLV